MKKLALSLLTLGMSLALPAMADDKAIIDGYFNDLSKPAIHIADQLWDWAETAFHEEKSSQLMQQTLKDAGFKVEAGVAGMPTAFVASFGNSGPVIGILAEMDALPGLSQSAVPSESPVDGKEAGHACGHNLFAGGSVTAAIAVKRWLEETGTPGQIRLYGTPAEEGGSGKVYMVREGLFKDVDTVFHWHAGPVNTANAMSSLANKTAKFRFKGTASHAAAAPERGRSALDAVEAMNFMVNMMREHIPSETRIHYIITDGGKAPNVVPEAAEVYYYLRTPRAADLAGLWERLENTAKAAALGTGTEANWEIISGVWDIMPNLTLAKVMHDSMSAFGGIQYSAEEQKFAESLRPTLGQAAVKMNGLEKAILPFNNDVMAGTASTDVGDVSWTVPTAGVITASWVPGTAPHSWQAVAAGGSSIGHKGMILAAETIALSALKLYQQPSLIEAAKAEFNKRKGEVEYYPQLGKRAPALDLR